MPTIKIFFFIALLCGSPLFAQSSSGPEAIERQWREIYWLRQLEDWHSGNSKQEDETVKRREAQVHEWQFLHLAQRFIDRWKDLAEDYKERGAVNPKKFKAVSKAFRDLEKSDGWLASK
jgi:hypothetical protein